MRLVFDTMPGKLGIGAMVALFSSRIDVWVGCILTCNQHPHPYVPTAEQSARRKILRALLMCWWSGEWVFDGGQVLYEAGVVKALVHLASGPDSAASRLAADAIGTLQLPVPHKLSQYVPLWTNEDVTHWVAQVGDFDFYAFHNNY